MKVSNWEKRTAVAQVSLAFKTYALSVEKNPNVNIQGDLIVSWGRNSKKYLVVVVPRIKRDDTKTESFKSTIMYCRANNIRMVVVAWECENRLNDYVIDADPEDNQEFKIIEFSRLDAMKKEFISVQTKIAA